MDLLVLLGLTALGLNMLGLLAATLCQTKLKTKAKGVPLPSLESLMLGFLNG